MSQLSQQHCRTDVHALDAATLHERMRHLSSRWQLARDQKALIGEFEFDNYYQTQAFVNAVAYIAHRQDHHPDIEFGYRSCRVRWWTHSVNGISENDLICAARIDALEDS
ncbi:MAG: 4a-hydroxytetrahydrobiopterin dehydratase [Panacagrimonas sp.]